jgi:hypothetical protein
MPSQGGYRGCASALANRRTRRERCSRRPACWQEGSLSGVPAWSTERANRERTLTRTGTGHSAPEVQLAILTKRTLSPNSFLAGSCAPYCWTGGQGAGAIPEDLPRAASAAWREAPVPAKPTRLPPRMEAIISPWSWELSRGGRPTRRRTVRVDAPQRRDGVLGAGQRRLPLVRGTADEDDLRRLPTAARRPAGRAAADLPLPLPSGPAGLKVRRVAPWPAVGISWRLRLAHEPTNGRCVWPRQSGHVYYPRCYRSTAAQPW